MKERVLAAAVEETTCGFQGSQRMVRGTVQGLALLLAALALVPAGAHLFELPNKIDLARDQYFLVQGIYRGWSLLGIVSISTIVANLCLVFVTRGERLAFWSATLALACSIAFLAVFFTWTYPANVATENWTVIPDNWQSLRTQWEYSHAANAILSLISLCAVIVAVVSTHNTPGHPPT
jgi:hypothetical protein